MSSAAFALLTISFNTIDYQDVASLSTTPVTKDRWLAHMPAIAGNTVHEASYTKDKKSKVIDPVATGSVNASAINVVAISTKPKPERIAQKIRRSDKGNRVVSTAAQQAPKNFSAGSVLQEHSLFNDLNADKKLELAFVKPKTNKQAYQVATLFHLNKPKAPEHQMPQGLPIMVASLVKESRSSVLSYAPQPKAKRSPFAAILKSPVKKIITPKLGKGDHKWADDPLPKSSFSKRQQRCLAQGIYFEARGESVRGQAAVSQVILNRVRNPHYPNSICGVVYQNKHWRNRCQFSFACDRIKDKVRDHESWNIAKHVATETTAGRIWFKQVGSSTHYHATYVRPRWARSMKRVGKVGLHIFYRTKRGGWS